MRIAVIRNRDDLQSAILMASADTRWYIERVAKSLNAIEMLPENWQTDGHLPDFRQQLDEEAITAAIRIVRTPEGAKRYGLPIGSVIEAKTKFKHITDSSGKIIGMFAKDESGNTIAVQAGKDPNAKKSWVLYDKNKQVIAKGLSPFFSTSTENALDALENHNEAKIKAKAAKARIPSVPKKKASSVFTAGKDAAASAKPNAFVSGKQESYGKISKDPAEKFIVKKSFADGATPTIGMQAIDADGNQGEIVGIYQTYTDVNIAGKKVKYNNKKLNAVFSAGSPTSAPAPKLTLSTNPASKPISKPASKPAKPKLKYSWKTASNGSGGYEANIGNDTLGVYKNTWIVSVNGKSIDFGNAADSDSAKAAAEKAYEKHKANGTWKDVIGTGTGSDPSKDSTIPGKGVPLSAVNANYTPGTKNNPLHWHTSDKDMYQAYGNSLTEVDGWDNATARKEAVRYTGAWHSEINAYLMDTNPSVHWTNEHTQTQKIGTLKLTVSGNSWSLQRDKTWTTEPLHLTGTASSPQAAQKQVMDAFYANVEKNATHEEDIKTMDSAFYDSAVTPMKDWMLLSRAGSAAELTSLGLDAYPSLDQLQQHVGKEITLNTYKSSSITTMPAFSGPCRFLFKCPPGTRGIYVGFTGKSDKYSSPHLSNYPDEREVILPKGMKVKIIEATKSTDSSTGFVHDVVLEVVPDNV